MGGWHRYPPAAVSPVKSPVLILELIGWAPGPVWMGVEKKKYLAAEGFESRTVHPVASLYADHYLIIRAINKAHSLVSFGGSSLFCSFTRACRKYVAQVHAVSK